MSRKKPTKKQTMAPVIDKTLTKLTENVYKYIIPGTPNKKRVLTDPQYSGLKSNTIKGQSLLSAYDRLHNRIKELQTLLSVNSRNKHYAEELNDTIALFEHIKNTKNPMPKFVITDIEALKDENNKRLQEIAELEISNKKLTEDNEVKDANIEKIKQDSEETEEILKQRLVDMSNKNKELRQAIPSGLATKAAINPSIADYVKNKVINSSYTLSRDDLTELVKNDIDNGVLPPDADFNNIVNSIYNGASKYIINNIERIKTLASVGGYNNEILNKLPPEINKLVQNQITEKINEDIRKKNIKYILPKEFTKIKNLKEYGINPLLKRSAWKV